MYSLLINGINVKRGRIPYLQGKNSGELNLSKAILHQPQRIIEKQSKTFFSLIR